MVVAGVGDQHGTVEDRSIITSLRRRLPDEAVERLDGAARQRLQVLARKWRRWTNDHRESIQRVQPIRPCELDDRAADNWEPLLAIASLAGPAWLRRATQAAVALQRGDTEESLRELLLEDLCAVWVAEGANAQEEGHGRT